MTKKLFISAITKVVLGIIILALLLFIPAGTLRYTQAWLLLGILFIPMIIAGFIMMARNPELLKKRLNAKEEQSEQKEVVLFSGIMFAASFIAAGLSYRFNFLMLPMWVSYAATAIFLLAYGLYAEVLKENTYLSRRSY